MDTTFLHFPKALPQLDPTESLLIDAILKGTVKLIDLRLHYILHQLYLFFFNMCIDFTLQQDVVITYSLLQLLVTFAWVIISELWSLIYEQIL